MQLTEIRGSEGSACRGGWLAAVVGLVSAGLVVLGLLAQAANAAGPCGRAGVFSSVGSTGVCTYTAVGQDTFAAPPAISSIRVLAVGGAGGAGGNALGSPAVRRVGRPHA